MRKVQSQYVSRKKTRGFQTSSSADYTIEEI